MRIQCRHLAGGAMVALAACFLPVTGARADDCSDAATQMDMNVCADKAFKQADGELNATYKQIVGRLKDDSDTTKLLVSAQRAWVAFRDAECAFSTASVAGGSIYPTMAAQCRTGLTEKRIDDLKGYLQCEEGDLSCPVPPAN